MVLGFESVLVTSGSCYTVRSYNLRDKYNYGGLFLAHQVTQKSLLSKSHSFMASSVTCEKSVCQLSPFLGAVRWSVGQSISVLSLYVRWQQERGDREGSREGVKQFFLQLWILRWAMVPREGWAADLEHSGEWPSPKSWIIYLLGKLWWKVRKVRWNNN